MSRAEPVKDLIATFRQSPLRTPALEEAVVGFFLVNRDDLAMEPGAQDPTTLLATILRCLDLEARMAVG